MTDQPAIRGVLDPRLGPGRGLLPDLPGPLRAQRAGPRARAAGAVGQPADRPRLQGRRPARGRRAPRPHPGPRAPTRSTSTRSSSRRPTTATTRTTTWRSTRSWAAMPPCASSSTPATRAACGSCSTACSTTPAAGSGRSTTSWRRASRRHTVDWFFFDREALDAGRPLRAYPLEDVTVDLAADQPTSRRAGQAPSPGFGYQAWWGLPALPKLNTDDPARPGLPARRRRALDPVRRRRLAAGRRRGGARRVLAGVPPAGQGRRPGRLHRGRDLVREARRSCAATSTTPLMNYPLGAAITSFVGRRAARPARPRPALHDRHRGPRRGRPDASPAGCSGR